MHCAWYQNDTNNVDFTLPRLGLELSASAFALTRLRYGHCFLASPLSRPLCLDLCLDKTALYVCIWRWRTRGVVYAAVNCISFNERHKKTSISLCLPPSLTVCALTEATQGRGIERWRLRRGRVKSTMFVSFWYLRGWNNFYLFSDDSADVCANVRVDISWVHDGYHVLFGTGSSDTGWQRYSVDQRNAARWN